MLDFTGDAKETSVSRFGDEVDDVCGSVNSCGVPTHVLEWNDDSTIKNMSDLPFDIDFT